MKIKSFSGMRCSVAGALELIGDRWTLLIVRDLVFGSARFDELKESSGIPTATLSTRLKKMEEHGIIEKVSYQERPRRDEYKLSEKGRDLWKTLAVLLEWSDKWDATGFGSPTIEMIDLDSGRPIGLRFADKETGKVIEASRVGMKPGPAADENTLRLLAKIKRD